MDDKGKMTLEKGTIDRQTKKKEKKPRNYIPNNRNKTNERNKEQLQYYEG